MSVSEVPRGPEDIELRNIIDKLAQFVAKNGQEFELMTKQKQQDNPRFAFLRNPHDPHYDYYQYRVQAEQALLKKMQSQPPPPLLDKVGVSSSSPADISSTVTGQIQALEQQIKDSENNLKAQYEVLMQQQQAQIEDAIRSKENDKVKNLAQSVDLNLTEFSGILDTLISSCTKDHISASKQWIFSNCQTDRLREIILIYMFMRVSDPGASQDARLHILYLINDWAHYCMRKKQDGTTAMLSRYVPKMYAYAIHNVHGSTTEGSSSVKDKLEKLMGLWETQKYFNESAYKQLRNPSQTYTTSQNATNAEYNSTIAEVIQKVQNTYASYQTQHREFTKHVQNQINSIQAQAAPPKRRSRFDSMTPGPPQAIYPSQTPLMAPNPGIGGPFGPPADFQGPPPPLFGSNRPPLVPPMQHPPPPTFGAMGVAPPNASWPHQPPPPLVPPLASFDPDDPKLIPKMPYYDLPAALMVPLVKLEDTDYLPIEIGKLRLPPPVPPTDRLMSAVEAFYGPPTHDAPRDADGWEKSGLYEFYRAKRHAKEDGKKPRKPTTSDQQQDSDQRGDANGADREKQRSRSRSSSSSSSSSSNSSSSSSKSSKASSDERRQKRRQKRDDEDDRRQSAPVGGESWRGDRERGRRRDDEPHHEQQRQSYRTSGKSSSDRWEEQAPDFDAPSAGMSQPGLGVESTGDPFEQFRRLKSTQRSAAFAAKQKQKEQE